MEEEEDAIDIDGKEEEALIPCEKRLEAYASAAGTCSRYIDRSEINREVQVA